MDELFLLRRHQYSRAGHPSGNGYLADVAKLLERRGLQFQCDKPTESLGNCFPYSIMQQLHRPDVRITLSEDMKDVSQNYLDLRVSIVNFVRKNLIDPTSEYYGRVNEAGVEYTDVTGENWDTRLREMYRDGIWFDDLFVEFTSWFLKRDIMCHTSSFTRKYCPSQVDRPRNYIGTSVCECVTVPLHIVNLRDVHFQSVIPMGTQYRCDQCIMSFARPQYLTRHIQVDHPIVFPCDECEEIFPALDLVLEHVKKVHLASQDRTCVICNREFDNEQLVADHMKGHFLEASNSEKSKVFSCTDVTM